MAYSMSRIAGGLRRGLNQAGGMRRGRRHHRSYRGMRHRTGGGMRHRQRGLGTIIGEVRRTLTHRRPRRLLRRH